MFRIGGQADQGSGIMSHVEPKRVHRATGGRIGYKYGFGTPSWYPTTQGMNPRDESGLDILLRNYGANNLDIQGSGLNSLRGNTESSETSTDTADKRRAVSDAKIAEYNKKRAEEMGGIPTVSRPEIKKGWGWLESDLDKAIREKKEFSSDYNSLPYTAAEKVQLRKSLSTARDQEKLYDLGTNVMEGEDRPAFNTPTAKNKPNFSETVTTDPREAIKKDRDFLKSLLEGDDYENMGKAEAAFIISRAIAEPGPIANKIKVANELAIPLIRSKRKDDRELTLEAYKTYRERELEDVKSGRPGDVEKRIRARADAYIKGNPQDPRTQTEEGKKQILDEAWTQQTGEDKPLDKVKQAAYMSLLPTIQSKNSAIKNLQTKLNAGEKLSKEEEKILKDNLEYIKDVRDTYPEYFKATIKGNFKTGGRVGFAEGTTNLEYSTNEEPTIESTTTPANAGTQQSQIKPVVNLGFQELRSRLPQEITNDIVALIANSKQALQDFAYIKTQQDVNNFNVKYGVNLVLPSNR